MKFDDAGAFSRALSQSNVVCMQTSPGGLEFNLTILILPELELHFTSLPFGGCIALGDTAKDSVSFHVPLSGEGSMDLLGMPADAGGLAAYARGGELAVSARSGARLAYIVPSSSCLPELSRIFCEEDEPADARKAHRITAEVAELNKLKTLLFEIARIIEVDPAALNNAALAKNLQQSLLEQVFSVTAKRNDLQSSSGRGHLAHAQIVRKVHDYLHQFPGEPVYVLDLCRALGISQPTLFRAFRQTLGIGPKEFLQVRRLHVCREKLLNPTGPRISIHAVAHDLGFWHLGRFGRAYREMFGETPSQTVRTSRRIRNCN